MSNLLKLPYEILIKILQNLEASDLYSAMLTCKTFLNIIQNENVIWRFVYRKKFIIVGRNDGYRDTAYNKYRISSNWCRGTYHSKIIIQHNENYMPWLKYHNSQCLLLSVGSELRCYATDRKRFPTNDLLWTIEVPKVKKNDVQTYDISRFIVKDNTIVCGVRNGTATVYKYDDIKSQPKLQSYIPNCGMMMEVSAVEMFNKEGTLHVVTACSHYSQLFYWFQSDENNATAMYTSINSFVNLSRCRVVRISEDAGVKCLSVNNAGDKLAVGLNKNNSPLLLDITTSELLLTADATYNHIKAIRDIQWHNENTISYVTHSGRLASVDIRTSQVVYEASDPFQATLYCLKTDGERAIVAGSSQYCRCVLYDTRQPKRHVQMYFTRRKSSPVYSLDFDSTKLIAAVDRGVSALNFNVNPAKVRGKDYSHAFQVIR